MGRGSRAEPGGCVLACSSSPVDTKEANPRTHHNGTCVKPPEETVEAVESRRLLSYKYCELELEPPAQKPFLFSVCWDRVSGTYQSP